MIEHGHHEKRLISSVLRPLRAAAGSTVVKKEETYGPIDILLVGYTDSWEDSSNYPNIVKGKSRAEGPKSPNLRCGILELKKKGGR